MLYRRRLRSRIIVSFLLFGTLLSCLFAISTLFLQSNLEDQLIGATLKQELDDYLVQLHKDPTLVDAVLNIDQEWRDVTNKNDQLRKAKNKLQKEVIAPKKKAKEAFP